MILLRKSNDRGRSQIHWLDSFHTFSFGEYYDPKHMGFESLRVINDDFIQPGKGFGRHPHRDMEIITYVVDGSLEHKDSMGTGSIIRPGEIQRMSAGTGIEHSEFNHSSSKLLHLLQIWILPEKKDLAPSYEQKTITKLFNQLILIGSREPSENAVTIHQDVKLFVAYLDANNSLSYEFSKERHGWLQLIKGEINLNGHTLFAGDGAAISDENKIAVNSTQNAELLLFDLG